MEIFNLGTTTASAMTADFSIPMALVDFLPVLFFFLAACIVTKDLYNKVSRGTYTLLSAGTIMCFIGGAFKALWKVLFIFGINYPVLYTALFLMQAPGFCLYFVGLILALKDTKSIFTGENKSSISNDNLKLVSAITVTTSLPLIAFQTIGSIGSLICLAVFAKRMKKPSAIICFILSIVLLLTMGYLGATLDSSLSLANWLAQGINTLGQMMLYVGVLILHKNGFADKNFGKLGKDE